MASGDILHFKKRVSDTDVLKELGIYRKEKIKGVEEDNSFSNRLDCDGKTVGSQSGEEAECGSLSEYETDETNS
ncbi:OLC1v1005398C1 [Oldenlandia corymbosa var. corymbosa]|uniref:OLC1v1005398C1 n=1 Tax=Oldenlandia corymbosa var. corymbosa TaxID=529605 RepID=A0AAV1DHF6_OLDCO|nr:OLC1v1005398C1 [Oldenlandia corymbosa var. corymbosa]